MLVAKESPLSFVFAPTKRLRPAQALLHHDLFTSDCSSSAGMRIISGMRVEVQYLSLISQISLCDILL
jgi:hypothetical protein